MGKLTAAEDVEALGAGEAVSRGVPSRLSKDGDDSPPIFIRLAGFDASSRSSECFPPFGGSFIIRLLDEKSFGGVGDGFLDEPDIGVPFFAYCTW